MNFIFYYKFVASCFGVGFIPFASGTFGSIFAILFLLFFRNFSLYFLSSITFLVFILGVFLSKKIIDENYKKEFLKKNNLNDRVNLKKNKENFDPKFIVIDEVVGQFLTVILVKLFERKNNFASNFYFDFYEIIFSFIFFRLFDIFKPFPIKNIEKFLANNKKFRAFGVMFDDVLAAFFASIFVLILNFLIINFFYGNNFISEIIL